MNIPTKAEFRALTEAGLYTGQIVALVSYRNRLITAGRINNRLATPDTLAQRLGLPPPQSDH